VDLEIAASDYSDMRLDLSSTPPLLQRADHKPMAKALRSAYIAAAALAVTAAQTQPAIALA
jgi:hypothetical protein